MLIICVNGVMCYFSECVVLKGNHHVIRNNIDINKVKAKARVQYSTSSIQKKLYCNLDLYAVKRCGASFSFVDTTNIYRSVCFYLGMRTMCKDFWSTHYMNILLS